MNKIGTIEVLFFFLVLDEVVIHWNKTHTQLWGPGFEPRSRRPALQFRHLSVELGLLDYWSAF